MRGGQDLDNSIPMTNHPQCRALSCNLLTSLGTLSSVWHTCTSMRMRRVTCIARAGVG